MQSLLIKKTYNISQIVIILGHQYMCGRVHTCLSQTLDNQLEEINQKY